MLYESKQELTASSSRLLFELRVVLFSLHDETTRWFTYGTIHPIVASTVIVEGEEEKRHVYALPLRIYRSYCITFDERNIIEMLN